MLWIIIPPVFLFLVLAAVGVLRKKPRLLSDKVLRGQLKYFNERKPECPPGKVALVLFDQDAGVLMGGMPDDPPKFFETYGDALGQAVEITRGDEEMSVGLFDDQKVLKAIVIDGLEYACDPGWDLPRRASKKP